MSGASERRAVWFSKHFVRAPERAQKEYAALIP